LVVQRGGSQDTKGLKEERREASKRRERRKKYWR